MPHSKKLRIKWCPVKTVSRGICGRGVYANINDKIKVNVWTDSFLRRCPGIPYAWNVFVRVNVTLFICVGFGRCKTQREGQTRAKRAAQHCLENFEAIVAGYDAGFLATTTF